MSHALKNVTANNNNENFLILGLALQKAGLPTLLFLVRPPKFHTLDLH